MKLHHRREGGDFCAIFVHAGAGYHSFANEKHHLSAVDDAAQVAMTLLKNGADAVDAVEMSIKLLEDREITNAGYGSNLTIDGVVECDATIVDHFGRSGAVGAVSQIRNPIGLARVVLDESIKPLSLQRVPPNLLVGDGARDFADQKGIPIMPPDFLISASAKERWLRWTHDLQTAENEQRHDTFKRQTEGLKSEVQAPSATFSPPKTPRPTDECPPALSDIPSPIRPLQASTSDVPTLKSVSDNRTPRRGNSSPEFAQHNPLIHANGMEIDCETRSETEIDSNSSYAAKRQRTDGSSEEFQREDDITDTVGAIAVDCFGNIAAASSSGGIGMKHKGRCGPAALVGIGTAVIPIDPNDPTQTCVAAVTSGTGEHMATTMAAATIADRIYSSVRKKKDRPGLESCDEDEAMRSMIKEEFMQHPGVRNSHCVGAIGIMAVKKTKDGIFLYFGHNTDSFALASLHSEERKTTCVMSRSNGGGTIAQGGRAMHWKGKGKKS